ncbi:hypothetical protein [Leifsonia sp. Leaf264]|uniref:hypothetical protein n=1 Tax=Leifsonia sp. Leaf264 TaxID=1736314 RepID=UPI000AA85320|nr:hypothetical protein [Leifsonia sp. Leaf264]
MKTILSFLDHGRPGGIDLVSVSIGVIAILLVSVIATAAIAGLTNALVGHDVIVWG